jgi:hypothetical protein
MTDNSLVRPNWITALGTVGLFVVGVITLVAIARPGTAFQNQPAALAAGSVAYSGATLSPSVGLTRCLQSPNVIWDNANQGNVYGQSSLTITVGPCQTLLVSSGHMLGPDGRECGYNAKQICVLVFCADAQSLEARVTGLHAGNTWYGLTPSSVDAAVADKRPQFFASPNCSSSGCSLATLLIYQDGSGQPNETIRR